MLHELKGMAYLAFHELQAGNADAIGELLHESWELKKRLASQISNSLIDEIYSAARKAGAVGGKITGAGGGGFSCSIARMKNRKSYARCFISFRSCLSPWNMMAVR